MFKCKYCDKEFNSKQALCSHVGKIHKDQFKIEKLNSKVKVENNKELNITYAELQELRENHSNTCDICGKTEVCNTRPDSKTNSNRLCMDHDHNTLKFRGFLCNSCNRKLAWYEKEKDNIIRYLNNNR